jgi:hypothetical protein
VLLVSAVSTRMGLCKTLLIAALYVLRNKSVNPNALLP